MPFSRHLEIANQRLVGKVYGRKKAVMANNHPASSIIAQFGKHVLPWVGTDPDRVAAVRQALQDLVNGNYPVVTTARLSSVLQKQVDKVSKFLGVYGGGQVGFRSQDIPAPPAGAQEDELLLAVYLPDQGDQHGFFRTLDAWFAFAGRSRLTWRNPDLKSDPTVMRLTGEYRPGVRWVRFQRNHDAGKSSNNSRQRAVNLDGWLGGLEPLMAVELIDGYFDGWFRDGNVAPNLSAIEVSFDGGVSWGHVAYLDRWDDGDGRRRLDLDVCSAGGANPSWGSPLVSEC